VGETDTDMFLESVQHHKSIDKSHRPREQSTVLFMTETYCFGYHTYIVMAEAGSACLASEATYTEKEGPAKVPP
jgi:hypothetical protein